MNKVSIIIPTYQCAEYLPICIQSFQAQTYKNIEIIVIDDGSTDGTEEYMKQVKNVRYIRLPKNKGANYARNEGVWKAKGDYIYFSDADAYVRPTLIEEGLYILKTKKEFKWVYTDYIHVFEDGSRRRYKFPDFDRELLESENYCSFMSLVEKKVIPDLPEKLHRLQDWDLFLSLSDKGHKGYHIDRPMFTAYVRPDGISRQKNTNVYAEMKVRKRHNLYIPDYLQKKYEEISQEN